MADFAIRAAVRGNLDGFLKDLGDAVPRARTLAVRRVGTRVRDYIRKSIVAAGLTGKKFVGGTGFRNKQFEKSIQLVNEPKQGFSISPRSVVISKAIVNRPSGKVDLVTVFQEGATIRPVKARALFNRRTAGGTSFFRNLGQEVKLRRRLDLVSRVWQLLDTLPEQEATELDKLAVRAARRAAR